MLLVTTKSGGQEEERWVDIRSLLPEIRIYYNLINNKCSLYFRYTLQTHKLNAGIQQFQLIGYLVQPC